MAKRIKRPDSAGLALFLIVLFTLRAGSESIQVTTYMPSPSGNMKKLRTTEDTYLAINANNRVGIGTPGPLTNANDKLHIVGNNDGGFFLTGIRPRIKIQDSGGTMYAMEGTGDRLDFCRFGVACDMTLRNGNVGISNNNPTQRLHVNGGMQVGDIRTEGSRMTITGHDGGASRMFWFRLPGADPQAPTEGASPFLGVRFNGSNQAEYARLSPGGVAGVFVLRNGRVGIGRSPDFDFDVAGESRLRGPTTVGGTHTPRRTLDVGTGGLAANQLALYKNLDPGAPYWLMDVDPNQGNNMLRIYSNVGGGEIINFSLVTGHMWLKKGGITLEANTSPSIHLAGNGRLSLSDRALIETFGGRVLIYNDSNASFQGTIRAQRKFFRIQHPLDPKNKDLVHGSLEGPELGVYYRGQGQLVNGQAVIKLPNYFEALTLQENRTVLLTPQFDSSESISYLAASKVENGQFTVRSIDDKNPSQKFYWEVKAVRADTPPLKVEVDRELQLSSSKP